MCIRDSPYIISFTIQKDGKLIDGHTIDYAIRFIDDNVSRKPVCYIDVYKRQSLQRFQKTERLQALHRVVQGIRPLPAGLLRLCVLHAGASRAAGGRGKTGTC